MSDLPRNLAAEELAVFINRLPQRSAERLQRVVIRNFLDHRNEIARASDFEVLTRRQLIGGGNRGVIRIDPPPTRDAAQQRKVTRLRHVTGAIYTVWHGQTAGGDEPVAARIEKTTGRRVITPRRSRYLVIPTGDYLTNRGMPRRAGGRGENTSVPRIADEPDTHIIRMGSRLVVIQNLAEGETGRFERKGGSIKGIRKNRLGRRTRVIATLVREAEQTRPLDFFGSWNRLAARRQARYQRMLADVLGDGQRARA